MHAAEGTQEKLPFSLSQLDDNNWYPHDTMSWEELHGASMVEFSIRFALRGSGRTVLASDVLGMVDNLLQEGFLGSYLSEAKLEFNRTWLEMQGNITVTELLTEGVRRILVAPLESIWFIGERVRVKEIDGYGWRQGMVTGVFGTQPAVVVDGTTTAYTWAHVERLESEPVSPMTPPSYADFSHLAPIDPRLRSLSEGAVAQTQGMPLDLEDRDQM